MSRQVIRSVRIVPSLGQRGSVKSVTQTPAPTGKAPDDGQVIGSVLVQGAGTLGLLACSMASRAGTRSILVIDTVTDRLKLAERFGTKATAIRSTNSETNSEPEMQMLETDCARLDRHAVCSVSSWVFESIPDFIRSASLTSLLHLPPWSSPRPLLPGGPGNRWAGSNRSTRRTSGTR